MKWERGFSLLETIVSLSLFCLLFVMIFPFLQLQKELWIKQETFREEFRTMSSAMGWLTKDIQEAGYHCTEHPIQNLEEDALSYEMSRDEENPDSFSPDNGRLVSVYMSGEKLMYRIQSRDSSTSTWSSGSTHTLASGLSEVAFRGFDRNGVLSSEPSKITAVEVKLRGNKAGTLKTMIAIRNPSRGSGS